MSDLSLQLQQAASQLPVSSYFDEALFQRERDPSSSAGPRYVGHHCRCPKGGDYYALPQEGEGRAWCATPRGVELISNVCRHRQAGHAQRPRLAERAPGAGATSCARCTAGCAPASTPAGSCWARRISHTTLPEPEQLRPARMERPAVRGQRRDIAADLANMGPRAELDFTGMVLDRVELHECNYNWKTFIEVYLEDYHVGPSTRAGQFVTCDDLRWEFKDHYSVQTVGVANRLGKPGSPVYERWRARCCSTATAKPPVRRHLAHLYPHIMVEWYPHVLTVSTLHPDRARRRR